VSPWPARVQGQTRIQRARAPRQRLLQRSAPLGCARCRDQIPLLHVRSDRRPGEVDTFDRLTRRTPQASPPIRSSRPAGDPAWFCEIETELDQFDDFTTASPDEARDLVARTRDLLAEAENVAPDEISSANGVTADAFRQTLDFYADADFDVERAEFEAALVSGEVEMFFTPPEAEMVFDWLDENCAP
jgi:hypothetical protein